MRLHQRVLILATVLLLTGCGRSDQFGDELTPQPVSTTSEAVLDVTPDVVEPTQDAASAPAVPETPAEGVYPGPDAAVAPEYVNPNVIPDKAYPEPPIATPAPGDDQGFVTVASGEIGIIIDTRNNTVVEVVPNSPAQAAGIEVGDVITQFEDQGIGDKFKDAKKVMGGKLHKQVKIEVERQGKKRKLSIKASTLILPTDVSDQPEPTPILDPYTYL